MNTTRKLLLLPSLATVLLAGCAHHYPAYYGPPPPPPPQAAAPDQFFQHGLHDGFEAARHDVSHNDPPNFERHRNFRNPPVPRGAIDEYRQAFHQGYDQFLHQPGSRPAY